MNRFNNINKLDKNSRLKINNEKKIKILYDLYCKNPFSSKKKMLISRINSACSLNEIGNKNNYYHSVKNYNILNKHKLNLNTKNNHIYNNLIFNNNQKWILKLINFKKIKIMYHYDKHFRINENCPLCQEINKKNEENIIKKGISPIIQKDKKNNSKTSLNKRRVYSAHSIKHKNQLIKSDINYENEYDENKSKNILTNNKSGFHSLMHMNNNKKNKKPNLKKKLIFNRNNQEINISFSNNNNKF